MGIALVQSLAVERVHYRTRAGKRILRETVAFFKSKITALYIAAIGLIVTFLFNHFYLHAKTAAQLLGFGAFMLLGSYGISFFGAFIINAMRVPWLLDVESGELVNALEQRAVSAESRADESARAKQESERLHNSFGTLMQAGVAFFSQLAQCQTEADFASWDRHFKTWLDDVRQAILQMGYKTDSVEFVRAGEAAEPVRGVMDFRNKQEERRRVLTKHQDNLAEFARRRLP
jgi:hypothetical protein